jgi:hypothetical protein
MIIQKKVKPKEDSAKAILLIFIMFALVGYFFVSYTGFYNGDYLGIKSKLPDLKLFLNFIITVLPFFILYFIYNHYRFKTSKYKITLPISFLGWFMFFLLILNIIITIFFGVAKSGREIYIAPLGIKTFIQIIIRFNTSFGVFLYIVTSKKNNKFQILLLLLLFVLNIIRASFGIFFFIGIYLIIQYYEKIKYFLKKYLFFIIVVIILSPFILKSLYNIREGLRTDSEIKSFDNVKSTTIVFGVLFGRLSSFSNSAIVMERKTTMMRLSKGFTPTQYFRESLTAIYGGFVDRERILYSNILLESQDVHIRTSSFMLGTQGLYLISIYQSFMVFIVNIMLHILIVLLTFNISMLFDNEKVKVYIFFGFCLTVLSGVGSEYMGCLVTVVLYFFLFLLINFITKYSIIKIIND